MATFDVESQLDVERIRADFPILHQVDEEQNPLVYLDNGASSQRPKSVIDCLSNVYEKHYANVHRGAHRLSGESTDLFEEARRAVQRFIGASSENEVIFTSGTTMGINLVARSWGDANVTAGDEILLTEMEHHSNLVPWHQLAERTGATIRAIPVTVDGQLDLNALPARLSERTKIVAFAAVSNVLGTINPVREITEAAHAVGAKVLVDAAQSVPHEAIDVVGWDADFVAFSGHKMLGPSGVGVLYGKQSLLEEMPPFLGGGSMIDVVEIDRFTPAMLPAKFEAGTPPIADAIAMKPAIEYLEQVCLARILQHEQSLAAYAHELLADVPGLKILGPDVSKKAGIVSFVIDGLAASDIATFLDGRGIAVREGHHCTLPLHKKLGISASVRASFYLYNTREEVEKLADAVRTTVEFFG
ncbi:aminotransferase class V-fold PLP-dependent enzyme [Bremerella sp. P1]|uniref:aminotransferase class V-fold PLP-dependent enzyme n=1 Tax=Bremerella sp. P1 TaxID=3026424 RepID=UPI0023679C8B|nr:SufS family cysteine desulfurase [Bremerella sp. P1]WDI45136.1 SufS family cysteine desulfurase [Bremerella sp. P1]